MENIEDVQKAAAWCLNCKNKPCVENGCPIKTDIPGFIEQIKKDNYKEAYNILIKNNIFSEICSIVCPKENQCEGSCIRSIKQNATKIGELENFVNTYAKQNKFKVEIEKKEISGKKVAIVGSGPAGLECAVELLKNGYDVTIFEKEEKLGGILRYGIPDFRLSKEILDNIINNIEKMGAKFKTNTELGKDFTIISLKKEYDAVFLGIGAETSQIYSLSEKHLDKVYESDEFLKLYNENKYIENLGKVVVIGGGNVAIDSARAAVKMNAESVKILYRRDEECMPARKIEIEDCLKDGVEISYLVRVISANLDNEKMKSLNCIKTEIIDKKAVDVPKSEFVEDVDTVVFAIGLKPNRDLLKNQGITLNEYGYIEIDENGQTSLQDVYAGGDATETKSTVCRALAAGKKAADGIMKKMS